MKRFISFIFLILLCFIFLGGVSFAGIVPVLGQQVERAAIGPGLTDNYNFEYSTSATMLNVLNDYCILNQSSGMFDSQSTIKNIKRNHPAIKADGTIAAEIGTVLKGPIRDKPLV